jgi:hypothetical protein
MSTTTPRLQAARFVRADADHLDRFARRVFADQRGDLGGADVQADDQRLVALAVHAFLACVAPGRCHRRGLGESGVLHRRGQRARLRQRGPAQCKTVGVAQVRAHQALPGVLRGQQLRQQWCEAFQALFGIAAPEHHFGAVGQRERPAAALVHAGAAHAAGGQPLARLVVEGHDFGHLGVRAVELRQPARTCTALRPENNLPCSDSSGPSPSARTDVLADPHFQHVRPVLAHFRALHPRQRADRGLDAIQLHREEALLRIRQHGRAQSAPGRRARRSPCTRSVAAAIAFRPTQPLSTATTGSATSATASIQASSRSIALMRPRAAPVDHRQGLLEDPPAQLLERRCHAAPPPSAPANGWSCPARCSPPAGSAPLARRASRRRGPSRCSPRPERVQRQLRGSRPRRRPAGRAQVLGVVGDVLGVVVVPLARPARCGSTAAPRRRGCRR